MKVSGGEQEAGRADGSLTNVFALSRCSLKPFGFWSISSLHSSSPSRPTAVGAACGILAVIGGCSKGKLSTAHAQQHHPKRLLPLFLNCGSCMSRWVATTAALAQRTSSFPADRNPLPSQTSREKSFLKQNVQQSNSFQAYCGLYFYISLFSKFNICQREQKGILTSGFTRMSGGGWVCPLPWQCLWCVSDHTGETAQQQENSFSKRKDGQSALRKQ